MKYIKKIFEDFDKEIKTEKEEQDPELLKNWNEIVGDDENENNKMEFYHQMREKGYNGEEIMDFINKVEITKNDKWTDDDYLPQNTEFWDDDDDENPIFKTYLDDDDDDWEDDDDF